MVLPQSAYALKQALRLLLCPVDMWRYHEFHAVLRAYNGEKRALDLGSPKLLARVLATRCGARVTATDIVECLDHEVALFGRKLRRGALEAEFADATDLQYADSAFPFIYSVSVIEHIPDDGDTRAAAEIGRVLQKGGTAVMTIPVAPGLFNIWVDADPYGKQPRDASGRVFFSRVYDWPGLESRIVKATGLRLVEATAWQERTPGWYDRYSRRCASPASPGAIATKLVDWHWARTQIEFVSHPSAITRRGVAVLRFVKD
jgi:SAM-dependent methyltransferase